jgi:hypothetical protein
VSSLSISCSEAELSTSGSTAAPVAVAAAASIAIPVRYAATRIGVLIGRPRVSVPLHSSVDLLYDGGGV